MSRLTSQLMNTMPRLLLASPAHPLVSGRWATLHFSGRRSGRRFHLPVAYVVDRPGSSDDRASDDRASDDRGGGARTNDARILISTDSGWWHNIADGQPFKLTLRGRRRPATARQVQGEAVIEALRQLVELPGYTKAAGIRREGGTVTDAELRRAAGERVVLEIQIGERS